MTRVRFAPSPTGFLHVGGLRTALINYVFTKQNQGKLVLRIEDTDQNRKVEGAVEQLLSSLNWSGIEFDESPNHGEFGPYVQSERKDLYAKYIQELLDNDHAYACFCSSEELNTMREEQAKNKQPIKYNGKCKSLTKEEVSQKHSNGEVSVVRMKIPETSNAVDFNDLVRGNVSIAEEQLDDQVLLKSDGFPTYHLACVVDDHLMQISHVIRGEEWLSSTPKHILLYRYFGWEAPKFAHISLLLNQDRSKLSKRQGDVAVGDYNKKGILPEALLNFIINLGWTADNEQEFLSLDEMIQQFKIEKLSKSGAIFDLDKLYWINQHYIQLLDEKSLWEKTSPFLKKEYVESHSQEELVKMLLVIQSRMVKLSDVNEHLGVFFQDVESLEIPELLKTESAKTVLASLLENLKEIEELNEDTFKASIKKIQKEKGIKGKDLWKPIRVGVTFLEEGPDLPKVAVVLGKEKLINRIEQQLKRL